jgi:hypothetical protein
MASPAATAATDSATIVAKLLTTTDPLWWLGALLIVVGLPAFFWKLPETIKAISSYHDQHRKTSLKIQTERKKLENAANGRNLKKPPLKKGK